MTARATAALAAAAAVMLALLVAKVMAVNVMAGTVLACVLAVTIGIGAAYVLMATGKGAHVLPRRYGDDELTALPHERTIPRVDTRNEPPWQPAPAFQAAPVIEPDAITHGPPQPEPDAIIIAAGTVTDDGQVHSVRVAVLPPVACPALPQWVRDILGADSVDGAMAEISRVVHSWESNYTKGDARYLRALTDGAS